MVHVNLWQCKNYRWWHHLDHQTPARNKDASGCRLAYEYSRSLCYGMRSRREFFWQMAHDLLCSQLIQSQSANCIDRRNLVLGKWQMVQNTHVNRCAWICVWLFVRSIEHLILINWPKSFIWMLVGPNFNIHTVLDKAKSKTTITQYSI